MNRLANEHFAQRKSFEAFGGANRRRVVIKRCQGATHS